MNIDFTQKQASPAANDDNLIPAYSSAKIIQEYSDNVEYSFRRKLREEARPIIREVIREEYGALVTETAEQMLREWYNSFGCDMLKTMINKQINDELYPIMKDFECAAKKADEIREYHYKMIEQPEIFDNQKIISKQHEENMANGLPPHGYNEKGLFEAFNIYFQEGQNEKDIIEELHSNGFSYEKAVELLNKYKEVNDGKYI